MSLVSALVGAIAARAPRWSLATASRRGRRLGRLLYRLDRRHRTVALGNLRTAYPEHPAAWHERVARASFEQVGRTAIEMLWSPRLAIRDDERAAVVVGLEHLGNALAEGHGALVATAHFGNWELAGLALVGEGVPLVSIARPLDDPGLDRLIGALRTQNGQRILPKQNAVRGALRALRQGSAVVVMSDQNTLRHEAVFVPYFGRPAATTPALARLHLRSGAPIVPVLTFPAGSEYEVRVLPPIEVTAADDETAVVAITAAVTARIEEAVRACPEAWLWMHDRWRERP